MKNIQTQLTLDEAYDAMHDYLGRYYHKTHSDDVGGLLTDMSLLADKKPFDSAVLADWNRAVSKINNQKPQTLTIVEAYKVMVDYLSEYRDRINSKEIALLLSNMTLLEDGTAVDHAIWDDWMVSVNKILTQNPRVRPMLILTKP